MSTPTYLLPSGEPDWQKLDPLIVAARKKGASLDVLMQTFLLSKHKVCSRLRHLADAGIVICAWGAMGKLHQRGEYVVHLLRGHGVALHYLKMNKDGTPTHPLYIAEVTGAPRHEPNKE